MKRNEIVKRHSFENKKQELLRFSETLPSVDFKGFKVDGGIFGLGSHKVTGEEMNDHVKNLQRTFQTVNTNISDLYKEFRTVYEAFESLDKEYISGILIAVGSAEASSNQAKSASDKAIRAAEEANIAQERINKTIAGLKKTVDKLVGLQTEISSIKRLNSDFSAARDFVDKVDNIKLELLTNKQGLEQLQNQIKKSEQSLDKYSQDISNIKNAISKYRQIVHLNDVDSLWQSSKSQQVQIETLINSVNSVDRTLDEATHSIEDLKKALSEEAAELKAKDKELQGSITKEKTDVYSHISREVSALSEKDNALEKGLENTNNSLCGKISNVKSELESRHNKLEADFTSAHQRLEQAFSEKAAELKAKDEELNRALVETNKSLLQEIQTLSDKLNLQSSKADKRIKIAYGIAGFASVAAVTHIILTLVGVL